MTTAADSRLDSSTTPAADKAALRRWALGRRLALTDHQRETASARIIERLEAWLARQHPPLEALLVYRALPSEVNTDAVLNWPAPAMFAPVTERHDRMHWRRIGPETRWERGRFGVLEPASGEPWRPGLRSVLLCPLAAFDRRGNRLGMGKGCFDAWLGDWRRHLEAVVGLAFACQEAPAVPAEPHDVPLDWVLTEREEIRCRR